MASPFGVSMPDFEVTESQVYVVKKDSTVLGQVVSIGPQSNVPTRKLPRIGDTNKKTSYGTAEHSVSLEIYSEYDPTEMALIMSGGAISRTTAGWLGTEQIRLNPSITAYDLIVEVYSSATGITGDEFVGKWTLKEFKPSQLGIRVQADSAVTFTVNGECNDVYYTPDTGVGA
jgi:hypothetical protein